MSRHTLVVLAVLFIAAVSAQDTSTIGPEPTTEAPTAEPEPTTEAPTTAYPGAAYGAICNGFLLQCNRHSNTVACLSRRAEVPTTPEAPITSENPIIALLSGKDQESAQEVCETGLGVDLGRCQCSRNCKSGVYVEDGEFDADRDICVGLIGSTCTILVPNCTKNGHCSLLGKCVCDTGFVNDGNNRCVQAK